MGVIHPPWISNKWFNECPFNYCDHFGDKYTLAAICKICRDELKREEKFRRLGKDPYDTKTIFKEIGQDLAKAMLLLYKQAAELGIDLDSASEPEPETPPPTDSHPLFRLVSRYGDRVESILKSLEEVPIDTDIKLVMKARDVFSHSRHYAPVKIYRARSSRWREAKDKFMREIADSKTSALFAYVAIERNSKALVALAAHLPLRFSQKNHLRLAKTSLELLEVIRQAFFPQENLVYKEIGCSSYDNCFASATIGHPPRKLT